MLCESLLELKSYVKKVSEAAWPKLNGLGDAGSRNNISNGAHQDTDSHLAH